MSAEMTWPAFDHDGDPCEECGSVDPEGGWVNFGCSRDPDCPGGDCCDLPCLTCNPRGRVR